MGMLETILASVDAARRTGSRNIQDTSNNPALYVEKMTDALRNSNRGVVPTATPEELTNRPLSPSERVDAQDAENTGLTPDEINQLLGRTQ